MSSNTKNTKYAQRTTKNFLLIFVFLSVSFVSFVLENGA